MRVRDFEMTPRVCGVQKTICMHGTHEHGANEVTTTLKSALKNSKLDVTSFAACLYVP